MVQLAKFLLESCNREEMEGIVAYNPNQPDVHFPALLFRDLISYMKRRRKGRIGSSVMPPVRKVCLPSVLFLVLLCNAFDLLFLIFELFLSIAIILLRRT